MRTALIIEERFDIESLIDKHLALEMGFSCQSFPNSASGIDYLKSLKRAPDIIIVRSMNGTEASARMICNYFYDVGGTAPIIVIGNIDFPGIKYETLPEKFSIESLTRKVMNLTGITKDDLEAQKLPDYIAFPLHYFYLMRRAPCDIFIRIRKKDTDDQYIKRIHSGDELDKEAILRYEQMDLESFYVPKDDRNLMMDSIMAQALERLEKEKDNPDVVIELTSDSFNIVHDLIQKVGISEHTVKMAEATIVSVAHSIEENKEMGKLLKKILTDKTSYLYRHSFLVALFSKGVMSRLDWGTGTQRESQFERIVFVSLFHDITLESEELMKVRKNKQLQMLTPQERKTVLEHANLSGNLVQKYRHAPMGADVIIRQHHGSTNGLDLPERYTNAISPMAITFVVIEEFVEYLLNPKEGKISIKGALDHLEEEFKLPSFRRVAEALKASIISSVQK